MRVLEGKCRRVDTDALDAPGHALVAAQAPHHLPSGVGQAELAHVGAHAVVEGYGGDGEAQGRALGAVVGERVEVALRCIQARARVR